jgi:hypothetical protein
MAARRKKKTPTALNINDFRPGIDRVERIDGKGFVVDGMGEYAPVEVADDVMPENFMKNIEALSPNQAALMFEAIFYTFSLSLQGKSERLNALLSSGKVQLRFETHT